jgi:hypothetical protein
MAILSTTGAATTATWSVNGVQGGSSTVGTIDGTGLYHAPASLPSPATLTVAASASGVSGTASVTVVSATLTVSPTSATVPLGGTQQFTASLNGTVQTTAMWSVNGVQGGNSTVGTIDSTGRYTAPASFPSPNALMVTASASGASGSASLTVVYPNDNHTSQVIPIKLGTSGGNSTDKTTTGNTTTCCSGTLGSLVSRGGTFFILSNNHVLDKSGQGTITDPITQPGLVDNNCNAGTLVANLSQAAALTTSNVDAAIAQIVLGTVDTAGNILDLGAASASSIAPAPPSSTVAAAAIGQAVAKSGRSTGLTCSTVGSILASIKVGYSGSCGGATSFSVTFTNQVMISGGNFSAAGDSGSLVVTSDTARPLGLLFAGNSTSTAANPIQTVLNALQDPNTHVAPTIVGASDHPVSCQPTATASSATLVAGASSATLSVEELQRATAVKEAHAAELMRDPAIAGVGVGVSADNPKEAALVIYVTAAAIERIPPQIEGVRTKVIFGTPFTARPLEAAAPAPAQAATQAITLNVDDINRAATVKEAHVDDLMQQEGIQGVGVGRSEDNPSEPALVVYVETGKLRSAIPPEMDGVRTKIIEGDRFRAFDWGNEPKATASCSKPSSKANKRK